MRVAIAEDTTFFRAALINQLQVVGVHVTAAYEDAERLPEDLLRDPPDAVVLDLRMPPTHTDEGEKAARRIKQALPATGVLLLSAYNDTSSAMALIDGKLRGVGYLLKDHLIDATRLQDTLRRIAAGEVVVDPDVVARLVTARRHADVVSKLTLRERDVLQLMAEGHSNLGIATRLGVVPRTVESYVGNILPKLGLADDDSDTNRRVAAVLSWLRATGG